MPVACARKDVGTRRLKDYPLSGHGYKELTVNAVVSQIEPGLFSFSGSRRVNRPGGNPNQSAPCTSLC